MESELIWSVCFLRWLGSEWTCIFSGDGYAPLSPCSRAWLELKQLCGIMLVVFGGLQVSLQKGRSRVVLMLYLPPSWLSWMSLFALLRVTCHGWSAGLLFRVHSLYWLDLYWLHESLNSLSHLRSKHQSSVQSHPLRPDPVAPLWTC